MAICSSRPTSPRGGVPLFIHNTRYIQIGLDIVGEYLQQQTLLLEASSLSSPMQHPLIVELSKCDTEGLVCIQWPLEVQMKPIVVDFPKLADDIAHVSAVNKLEVLHRRDLRMCVVVGVCFTRDAVGKKRWLVERTCHKFKLTVTPGRFP